MKRSALLILLAASGLLPLGAEGVALGDATEGPPGVIGHVPLLLPCQGAQKGLLCDRSCQGTEAAQLSFCNGVGSCVPQVTYSCVPYQCRDRTCLASCVSDADCANGHACVNGGCVFLPGSCVSDADCQAANTCVNNQCVYRQPYCSDDPNTLTPGPGRYVVTSDLQTINCYPYVCAEPPAHCLCRCTSGVDCYGGYRCTSDGLCQ